MAGREREEEPECGGGGGRAVLLRKLPREREGKFWWGGVT
jgi:hypothetical protein